MNTFETFVFNPSESFTNTLNVTLASLLVKIVSSPLNVRLYTFGCMLSIKIVVDVFAVLFN